MDTVMDSTGVSQHWKVALEIRKESPLRCGYSEGWISGLWCDQKKCLKPFVYYPKLAFHSFFNLIFTQHFTFSHPDDGLWHYLYFYW